MIRAGEVVVVVDGRIWWSCEGEGGGGGREVEKHLSFEKQMWKCFQKMWDIFSLARRERASELLCSVHLLSMVW